MFFDNVGKPPGRAFELGSASSPKDRSEDALPAFHSEATNSIQANSFPPGLLGECAHWVLATSPRPVPEIALATALSILSGICGRAFNIKGQGLNQYILIVAHTGAGKDVAQSFPELFYNTLRPHVAAIDSFRGPSELASAPGFIKWLERAQSILCTFGEIGLLLAMMAKPNASPHLVGIKRVLLQMYSKSGRGNAFGASAYSDKEKTTEVIPRPCPTIIGECTPESFYSDLDDGLVSSGLIPRFMVFEYLGEQGALAKGFDTYQPCPQLVQRLADLAAAALTLNHGNNICDVGVVAEAEAHFEAYEQFARDKLNASPTENIRHLWNRAHLKALKLAAVQAVGFNPHSPVIGQLCAEWATGLVTSQTLRLVAKFEAGDVGRQVNDEDKQMDDVIRAIAGYIHGSLDEAEKYGGVSDEMHRQQVVTISHLQRRVLKLASFRKDKMGPTYALNRVLKSLLEGDELREIGKAQMQATFGTGSRGFCVANPLRFVKVPKGK